jgi:hypothetical protein
MFFTARSDFLKQVKDQLQLEFEAVAVTRPSNAATPRNVPGQDGDGDLSP